MDMEQNAYRIGQSKIFFRAGVLAHLEEERDLKLTDLIVNFQAQCRAYLARRLYHKRVQQSNAIRVLQRNGLAWLKLRNWQWWRLFTKVKPLLQITTQEAIISQRDEEIRCIKERIHIKESEFANLQLKLNQLINERNVLQSQLQSESEERVEAEALHNRLLSKNIELQELVNDLQTRFEESEEIVEKINDEKKKIAVNI